MRVGKSDSSDVLFFSDTGIIWLAPISIPPQPTEVPDSRTIGIFSPRSRDLDSIPLVKNTHIDERVHILIVLEDHTGDWIGRINRKEVIQIMLVHQMTTGITLEQPSHKTIRADLIIGDCIRCRGRVGTEMEDSAPRDIVMEVGVVFNILYCPSGT